MIELHRYGNYRVLEARRGRVSLQAHSHAINRPYVMLGAEDDCHYLAFGYGTDGSDPVVSVEVNLNGTRVGQLLADAYWWLDRRRRGG